MQEVYDQSGQHVVATRASAVVDGRDLCAVQSDAPADSPAKLGALLGGLGMLIGDQALAPVST